jgi:hypothetical protein
MMKSKLLLIVIILFSAMLSGCAGNLTDSNDSIDNELQPSSEYMTKGYYVMDKKDNKILVVSTERQNFSATGGMDEYYDAVWLSDAPEEIEIGQQVQFEIDGMMLQSYPGQARAKTVLATAIQDPEASELSVEEALRRALISGEVEGNKVLVVLSIRHFENSDSWEIDLKNTMNGGEYTIKVGSEDN